MSNGFSVPTRLRNHWRPQLSAEWGTALLRWGFWLLPTALTAAPVLGAELIYVSYGPLEFSLSVSALEVYAKEGKINQDLATYAGYLEQQQLEQLKTILQARVSVTPVAVAQFLYSAPGEILLGRVGEIIQTKANQPGFYAIRAAIIQAAADPEGLTLLNVLKKFPTNGIRINSERSFQIIEELNNFIRQTEVAIAAIEEQSIIEASAESSFIFEQDLRQLGSIPFNKQSINLEDSSRKRNFPVDIYLPQLNGRAAPVIVISHGLGNDRNTFAYLAQQLASYGFVVAVPEHPGSNAKAFQAVVNGLANEAAPPRELVDRPLDVKYLLDTLKRTYGSQLNLQQVGVLGQSFGGYTALALAGAKINFEQIQQNCQRSNDSLNISLLLQCRAVDLPPTDYQLLDSRVKAVIAINPISSTIFGSAELSKIQVPLMLVASSDDTVAPALPEQIQPFTWLSTPTKYLVVLTQGTHFSTLGSSPEDVQLPATVIGPNPTIAREYMKALSVAFFKTYIAGQVEYQPYLSAAYAQTLTRPPIPLSLIQSLTADQLRQVGNLPTPSAQP